MRSGDRTTMLDDVIEPSAREQIATQQTRCEWLRRRGNGALSNRACLPGDQATG